jgi:hypothetical protein
MKRIARSIKVLWRAESLLGTIRLSGLMKKAGMLAFAGCLAIFGVAMLDVSAFFALTPRFGQAGAALIVGLVDIALAIAGMVVAQSIKPGAEADMVIEMRDMALADLEAEVAVLEESVGRARKEITDLVRHPLTSLAPSLLVPTLRSVISSLRASRQAD